MSRKSLFLICMLVIPVGTLAWVIHFVSAAGPIIGCYPSDMTVKTGQMFYVTVAVSDTLDLYAWQFDATYHPEYLEYAGLVPGDHLRSDGAEFYLVRPGIVPGSSTNEIHLAAYTRLASDTGIDGSGKIAYILFQAVKQKTDGTLVALNDSTLVDRNALEITKSSVNSGQCKVIISDTAPLLIQPPVGYLLYLPTVKR